MIFRKISELFRFLSGLDAIEDTLLTSTKEIGDEHSIHTLAFIIGCLGDDRRLERPTINGY